MAKYLYVVEGDAPSTASPSFATGDPALVDAALEAIFERLQRTSTLMRPKPVLS